MYKEINKDNYMTFAAENYVNPQSVTMTDFTMDMKKIVYIKRLLSRYFSGGELKVNLIVNHIIVLFNLFGEAALPLMMYKMEEKYWSAIKTFTMYLSKFPSDYEESFVDVKLDHVINTKLNES